MVKKFDIHVKGGFSERKGLKKISDLVQITSLNERTRNKIYTAIEDSFISVDEEYTNELRDGFCEYLYTEIFSLTKDHIPKSYDIVSTYDYSEVFKNIYNIILTYEYNDVLDFVEGFINVFSYVYSQNLYKYKSLKDEFINKINNIFVDENVNYKIINNIVTDIISDEEIKSIDDTINDSAKVVSSHFQKALNLLYKTKDYDNSIKESITAVESMCQVITKKEKATLGDGLKELKSEIHPALKTAFEKLYGYTSDANGIRHANGIGEGNSTFAEAKYMLISCSAFINYLSECTKKDD